MSTGEGVGPIRPLIANDHVLVRSELRGMLQREPGIEVVEESYSGCEAVELCHSVGPTFCNTGNTQCKQFVVLELLRYGEADR